jgi:hypothetical protein
VGNIRPACFENKKQHPDVLWPGEGVTIPQRLGYYGLERIGGGTRGSTGDVKRDGDGVVNDFLLFSLS